MLIVLSVTKTPIRLTRERWAHIIQRHPEVEGQMDIILSTVENPDLIQEGDFGTLMAIKHFPQTPFTSKYLTVIYKELKPEDGFILTAYFAGEPSSRRKVIWRA